MRASLSLSLCTKVLDELRHLEDFFTSQNRQARQPMVGLYEQAQACTMVLPRLYLLNTVGACYILSNEAPARVGCFTSTGYDNKQIPVRKIVKRHFVFLLLPYIPYEYYPSHISSLPKSSLLVYVARGYKAGTYRAQRKK